MFEAAEKGQKLSKDEYKRVEPMLRADLLDAQFELSKRSAFPVIVLISGVRGAGKGETVNLLSEWMDPRHIHTHAFDAPSDEERERPPMWRYWRALPPKGKIGILFGSWYTAPIIDRVFRRTKRDDLTQSIDEINRFEKMLTDEGALVLKFWFHLGKKTQRKRLKAIEGDPATRWRITKRDWDFFGVYDRFYSVSEKVLTDTSTAYARWNIIEGSDPEYRALTVGRTLLDEIKAHLKRKPPKAARVTAEATKPRGSRKRGALESLDLNTALAKKAYQRELTELQGDVALLTRHPKFRRHSGILVFEGMDAAGKGGAIRRITAALDARLVRTIPIAAPTDEERAQPYLWRFWRHAPRVGRFVIYDRSWYGRVLVERVEGFCAEADWKRAFGEINDFEAQLDRNGGVVAKFWLQISKEEQFRRFKEREDTRFKRFKITAEDWRNRKRWDDYRAAAAEMIERTSTPSAPWTLVEANDKYFARIKVLRTLRDRIAEAVGAQ